MTGDADHREVRGRVADVVVMRATKRAPEVGDEVDLPVDRILLDGTMAARMLEDVRSEKTSDGDKGRLGFHKAQRFVIVPDAGQAPDEARRVRDFARKHSLSLQLEPQTCGEPAVVAADLGLVSSDDVVMGAWRDVGSLGGLGCVTLPADRLQLAKLATAKRVSYRAPRARVVRVEGRLPRWLGPFDLALAVVEAFGGFAPLAGQVVEFCGDTIDALTVPERMALCSTLAQISVAGVVAPDAATDVWLRARVAADAVEARGNDAGRRRLERRVAARQRDDRSATGEPDLVLDARRVVPRMVAPVKAARITPIDAHKPTPVSHVVLTGRVDDLRVYSEVARERRVKRGVHVAWIPASQRTLLHAIEEGLVTDLLRSGATLLPPGAPPPPLATGERRATTRAFAEDDVLVGPAMAASSALGGVVVDPETMRRQQPRSSRRV